MKINRNSEFKEGGLEEMGFKRNGIININSTFDFRYNVHRYDKGINEVLLLFRFADGRYIPLNYFNFQEGIYQCFDNEIFVDLQEELKHGFRDVNEVILA